MNLSFFIARRLKFKGRLAMLCIALSFFIMTVSVAVSSGFRTEIRNGLTDITGDVTVGPVNMNFLDEQSPISYAAEYLNEIESLESVASVRPAAWRAGIVKHNDNIHGVLIKGTEDFCGQQLEVSIPSRLSRMLSVGEGDDLVTYFIGEKVKVRKFHIKSVYSSVVDVDDKLIVYARMEDIQRLNGWKQDEVSTIEIIAEPKYRSIQGLDRLEAETGYLVYDEYAENSNRVAAVSSVSRYPQLFDWLELIDFNVLVILILMTIVAGFNMISGLLIMLFENISMIGTLKSLGMKNRSIASIFLTGASFNVIKGLLIGNIAAVSVCLIQKWTHLIPLNPDNYFVSFVPVDLNPLLILSADVVSYFVIMALLLIPCLFISKVDPATTIAMK